MAGETTIHGYLVVDRKTNAPDWDGELHDTVEDAISSLCDIHSFARTQEEADAKDLTHWVEVYNIHPVCMPISTTAKDN